MTRHSAQEPRHSRVPAAQPQLGQRIRALRTARGYTLAQLAALAGVSPSFLSMLETGKTSVAAPRLQAIAAAFHLSAADLLPDSGAQALIQTVRGDDALQLEGFVPGVRARMLARDLFRRIQPVLLELEPGASHVNEVGHAGEEFVYILRGTVELVVDRTQVATLRPGDGAHYPSALPHAYRNVGSVGAEILTVSTPPKPV